MDVFEAIRTRRSIRKYQDQTVPEDQIQKMLAAAMMAPSAMNSQPWHFVVITGQDRLREIAANNPHAEMTKDAVLAILVCADVKLEEAPGNWPLDCSAAVQNLLLAAHALGLGAVWTAVYPYDEIMDRFRQMFDLPENVMPHTFIPIGYPAEQPEHEDRYRQDRVHRNQWA